MASLASMRFFLSLCSVDWDTIRGRHLNTGAVARCFKQCEAECIFLRKEHAADKSFLIPGYPITPRILDDFEMVRRQYPPRRKTGHASSAYPIVPVLFR